MFSPQRLYRALAIIFAGMALGIMHFWWQFFNAELFPVLELSQIESNIYSLYLSEKSFFKPEMFLSGSLLISSTLLWMKRDSSLTLMFAAFNAGASVCLAGVSMSLGLNTGLYRMAHRYAEIAFEADMSILILGFIAALACCLIAVKANDKLTK